jgi:hypothetical protein
MATDRTNPSLARLALAGAAALLAAASAAGCQSHHDTAPDARHVDGSARHGEQFPRDTDPRPVDAFVSVQTANGARSDATLTADHFDGRGALNSLGRRKLDAMLRADEPAPLVVCLDLSRAVTAARAAGVAPVPADAYRQSVRAYLADRGMDDSQVDLRNGPNAARTHPARDGIRGLKEIRGETAAAEPSAETNPHALSANDLMSGAPAK